tara:strand:- start:102 stop:557 length:456 start_codon:yes stop_codon:yes gene_type:complete
MTQLNDEHLEVHSKNKDREYQNNKKSLDNEIKDLNYAITRLDLIKVELKGNIEIVYINRLNGILDKFVDVLSNLRTKNGTIELTQNQLTKQMIKKGFIEKESDLVNLHLQLKKNKKEKENLEIQIDKETENLQIQIDNVTDGLADGIKSKK